MDSDCRAWCGVSEAAAVLCGSCGETCWNCCSVCDGYGDTCLSTRCWTCRRASGEYCRCCMTHVCDARHAYCVCNGCQSKVCAYCLDFCNRCGSERCNLCMMVCYNCRQLYCIQSNYNCFATHRGNCRCKACWECFSHCADCCTKICECNGRLHGVSEVPLCHSCMNTRWKEEQFKQLKNNIDVDNRNAIRGRLCMHEHTDTYDYSQVLSYLIVHSVTRDVAVPYDILVMLLRRGPISKAAYFDIFTAYVGHETSLIYTYWQFLVLMLFAVTTHPDLLAFEAMALSLQNTLRQSENIDKGARRHYESIVRTLSKIKDREAGLKCRSMCTIFLNRLPAKQLPAPLFYVNGIDFSPIFDYDAQRMLPPIVEYHRQRSHLRTLLSLSKYTDLALWLGAHPEWHDWEHVLLWTLNSIVLKRLVSNDTQQSLVVLRTLLQRRYSRDTYDRCLLLLSKYYYSLSMESHFKLILLFANPNPSLKQLCLRTMFKKQLPIPRRSKSLFQLDGYDFMCVFDTFRY